MAVKWAWTALTEPDAGTRDSGDPLGFRAFATRLAREIAPGLTQSTSMTRGFALATLGLDLTGEYRDSDRDLVFRGFECLFVASQVKHHGVDRTPFAGKRLAAAWLQGYEEYPVDKPILKQQLSSGIWGAYRRSASYFGMVASRDRRHSSPAATILHSRGKELARACRAVIVLPNTPLASYAARKSVPPSVLDRFKANGHVASADEVRILSEAVAHVDLRHGGRLQSLRRVFADSPEETLTPDRIASAKNLGPEQRAAADAAAALASLMEAIEAPYREWITGDTNVRLDRGVLDLPGWQHADDWKERDLQHLQRLLEAELSLDSVQSHQAWLAQQRGAQGWDPGEVDEARRQFVPANFALDAVSNLFAEGVLG